MRNIVSWCLLLANAFICICFIKYKPMHIKANAAIPPDTFIRAADLSFTPQIKQSGWVFYDSTGTALDVLTAFKNNGCNTVRIRIWYNPINVHSSLSEVAAFAAQVKAAGMKVWIDFHYSDTWADPGHQAKPAAWQNLNDTLLSDSVYTYTRRVLHIINPEYVQIGNEINNGILWPDGSTSTNNGINFITFLKSGCKAARDNNPATKIIIHYAGYSGSYWFFNWLRSDSVDFDIIGLSYYPEWHGKILDSVANALAHLSAENNKPVMIAETSYPFTLLGNDNTGNLIGDTAQILSAYPPTLAGQKAYLMKIRSIVQSVPGGKGIGFSYWAPDWIAFNGLTSTNGSSGENQAVFDYNTKATPGMDVFHK